DDDEEIVCSDSSILLSKHSKLTRRNSKEPKRVAFQEEVEIILDPFDFIEDIAQSNMSDERIEETQPVGEDSENTPKKTSKAS
ncbi:Hypothetical protein FKW44_005099, partial [Caligus rogercresseyi]